MKWRIVVDEVNRGSQSPKLVARSCRMYDDIFYIYLIPSEEKAGFSEGRILQYAGIYIYAVMILLFLPPKRATIYLNKKLHTKERGILEHFEVY